MAQTVTVENITYPLSGSFDTLGSQPARAPKFAVGDMVTSWCIREPREIVRIAWQTVVPGFSGGDQWIVSVPGFTAAECEFRAQAR